MGFDDAGNPVGDTAVVALGSRDGASDCFNGNLRSVRIAKNGQLISQYLRPGTEYQQTGQLQGSDPDSQWSPLTPGGTLNRVAVDTSGQQRHGTLQGYALDGSNARLDGKMQFDGSGTYVDIPDQAFAQNDWSVSMRVTRNRTGTWEVLLEDSTNTDRGIRIENDNRLNLVAASASSSGTILADGEHTVGVVKQSGNVRYYIDGQPSGTATHNQNITFTRFGISASYPLLGLLDDCLIFATALSDAEMQFLHDGTGTDPGTPDVLELTFSEPNTITVDEDWSWEGDGTANQYITTQAVTTSSSASKMFPLTALAWLQYQAAAAQQTVWLSQGNVNGGWRFDISSGDVFAIAMPNVGSYAFSGVNIRDGLWHFVAITIDDDSGTAQLFVDGLYVAEVTVGTPSANTAFDQTNIGGDATGGLANFDGLVSNVRTLSRVLTADEILSAYTQGISGIVLKAPLTEGRSGDTVQSGSPVSLWKSQAPQQNHLEQAGITSRVTYYDTILDGAPGLLGDGVNQWMQTILSDLRNQPNTVFAVVKTISGSLGGGQYIVDSVSGGRQAVYWTGQGNDRWSVQAGVNSIVGNLNDSPAGESQLIQVIFDDANSVFAKNGADVSLNPLSPGTDAWQALMAWINQSKSNFANFIISAIVACNENIRAYDLANGTTLEADVTGYLQGQYLYQRDSLLLDRFSDPDQSGPLPSPRVCWPGPGTLTLVQTDGNFAIEQNTLKFVKQATPAWLDQGLYDPAGKTRNAGQMFYTKCILTSAPNHALCISLQKTAGLFNGSTATAEALLYFGSSLNLFALVGTQSAWQNVGSFEQDVTYETLLVLRGTGCFTYIRGGAFTVFTLLAIYDLENQATLYLALTNFNNDGNCEIIDLPRNLWLPTPLVSDSFSGDGPLDGRQTDNLAVPETGAAVRTWTQGPNGDMVTAAGRLKATGGADPLALIDLGASDGMFGLTASVFFSVVYVGIVIRYDATSGTYYLVRIANSNDQFEVVEMPANTVLDSASITVGAPHKIDLTVDGQTITARMDNGNEISISNATLNPSSTVFGVAMNTNGECDDFYAFPRTESSIPNIET